MVINNIELKKIVKEQRNLFKWQRYNEIIEEQNREVIESFLKEFYKNKDSGQVKERAILNLIFILGKIENLKSINPLVKIGKVDLKNSQLIFEIIDAIGDILKVNLVTDLNKGDRKTLLNFLKLIYKVYCDNVDILSGIAYCLDSLDNYSELEIEGTYKKTSKKKVLNKLDRLISSN